MTLTREKGNDRQTDTESTGSGSDIKRQALAWNKIHEMMTINNGIMRAMRILFFKTDDDRIESRKKHGQEETRHK